MSSSTQRAIALIVAPAYSGSSLLNLLLDSQERVRGLGEAIHLRLGTVDATCALCGRPVPGCPAYQAVDRDHFYRSLFDFYGDCDVLADSSKSLAAWVGRHRFEGEFEYRVLLLSKAPHEFAHSWIGHHRQETVAAGFQTYLDFYARELSLLAGQRWFKPWHCLRITYYELAVRTQAVLQRLCEFLDIPRPRMPSWQTDTHIINGNWMVAAQIREERDLFASSGWYLGGKYVGKFQRVFYDDQWQTNKDFIETCLGIYEQRSDELDRLLTDLRQRDSRQQMSVLERFLGRSRQPPLCPERYAG